MLCKIIKKQLSYERIDFQMQALLEVDVRVNLAELCWLSRYTPPWPEWT